MYLSEPPFLSARNAHKAAKSLSKNSNLRETLARTCSKNQFHGRITSLRARVFWSWPVFSFFFSLFFQNRDTQRGSQEELKKKIKRMERPAVLERIKRNFRARNGGEGKWLASTRKRVSEITAHRLPRSPLIWIYVWNASRLFVDRSIDRVENENLCRNFSLFVAVAPRSTQHKEPDLRASKLTEAFLPHDYHCRQVQLQTMCYCFLIFFLLSSTKLTN